MKKRKDELELLRMAIKDVLDHAKEPLTALQIYETPAVSSLNLPMHNLHYCLGQLYKLHKKPFPLARIPNAGRYQFAWFNPSVVKLEYPHNERREAPRREADAPVNAANSADFSFNPVEFGNETPPAPEANVSLPAGVRSITLTVGGVTVRIDLA